MILDIAKNLGKSLKRKLVKHLVTEHLRNDKEREYPLSHSKNEVSPAPKTS
ncbi:MAG: hypothetical protein LBE38_02215 [Deltaproteobacteria bacterium]|nr:hypothetical protein [Deltaproteobacteria bacterium]